MLLEGRRGRPTMIPAIESSRRSDLQSRREERAHLSGPAHGQRLREPDQPGLDLAEAAEALVRQLGDEDLQRRQQAASSLRSTGTAALPALDRALGDPRSLAREWACALLAGFGEAARGSELTLRTL